MTDKKEIFLSKTNTDKLSKQIYQTSLADGGRMKYDEISALVKTLQTTWDRTERLNKYESIRYDPVAEMDAINQDFITAHAVKFHSGYDWRTLKDNTNWSVDDWRNMDTGAGKQQTIVTGANYRFNNTIPLYQRQADRHYDVSDDGSGLRGVSLDQGNRETGDMDLLAEYADRPYRKVDDLDFPYYGQTTDESQTSLVSSLWKSA